MSAKSNARLRLSVKLHTCALFCFALSILLLVVSASAVDVFKVSKYKGGRQIWFESEAFDERNPEGEQHYKVVDKDDAFGKAMTRTGQSGGRISWTFDINKAGGKSGTWYFWAREINPSNQSDYLLVKGDPGDKEIPDAAPFPGGDGAKPFDNGDDRIFEQNVGPAWGWGLAGSPEGHTKELQDGENTMYIFHRQGNATVFWDVFVWADKGDYVPMDKDYEDAKEMTAKDQAVNLVGKLATSWGTIKSEY